MRQELLKPVKLQLGPSPPRAPRGNRLNLKSQVLNSPCRPQSIMSLAFTTSFQVQVKRRGRQATCRVRKASTPRAMAESWQQQAAWNAAGSGIQSKGIQTIEFIIRQDGTVEEKVLGVQGKDCVELTRKIEEALGKVVYTEKTEEYFQEVVETVPVSNNQVVQDQVVGPDDPLYVADPNIPSW